MDRKGARRKHRRRGRLRKVVKNSNEERVLAEKEVSKERGKGNAYCLHKQGCRSLDKKKNKEIGKENPFVI